MLRRQLSLLPKIQKQLNLTRATTTTSSLFPPLRFCSSSSSSSASGDASAATTQQQQQQIKVKVTFNAGKRLHKAITTDARTGQSLLNVALSQQIDIEAACDGTCACSTCHVYIDDAHFDKLPAASEDEEDMLDLALDRRHTSRLACQLTLTKEFEGMCVDLPEECESQFSS